MEELTYTDALTGSTIVFSDPQPTARVIKKGADLPPCTTLFFPGCSFINYAMPLVAAVYDTLREQGGADGISFLCCGKILSYELEGDALRASFEQQFCDAVARSSITRIVAACPNCVKALRAALAHDERTAGVELIPLPQVLASYGYQVDKSVAAQLIKGDPDVDLLLCAHDSCPDRETGEFARGMRDLLPEGLYADPRHSWKKSICCGSLPRAAGNFEAADKSARINGEEAVEIHADALVTACISCAFQLNMAQTLVPAVHVLELLYNWRIPWELTGGWMKIRFLFDDMLGVADDTGHRTFVGLTTPDETVADVERDLEAEEGILTEADAEAGGAVAFTDEDVDLLGE